jgi:hypothetical protein
VGGLTTAQLVALDNADLQALSTAAIRGLADSQLAALGTAHLDDLTGQQVAALTASQLSSLSTANLNALTHFDSLTSAQVAALTNTQIANLETADFAVLSSTAIKGLTVDQMPALTTAELASLTAAQAPGLETADLAALDMTQVTALNGSAAYGAMTTAQTAALTASSPVVLDLDGNGVQTLAASQGVSFDLDGTGVTRVGWVGAGDGLLALDRNGDGVINDGRELFGNGTLTADGKHAANGYAAMALEDSNHDGVLNALDVNWDRLRLWVDANHDGKTDAGELHTLAQHGVASISLAAHAGTTLSNGNLLGLESSWTDAQGQQQAAADVWFAKDRSADVPAVSELLATAPESVVLPGASAAPTPVSTTAAVPVEPRLPAEEEQRHLPLI